MMTTILKRFFRKKFLRNLKLWNPEQEVRDADHHRMQKIGKTAVNISTDGVKINLRGELEKTSMHRIGRGWRFRQRDSRRAWFLLSRRTTSMHSIRRNQRSNGNARHQIRPFAYRQTACRHWLHSNESGMLGTHIFLGTLDCIAWRIFDHHRSFVACCRNIVLCVRILFGKVYRGQYKTFLMAGNKKFSQFPQDIPKQPNLKRLKLKSFSH